MSLIGLGIILLIVAIIAYALGAKEIAGFSVGIAKWVIIAAVIIFVIFAIFGSTFWHSDSIRIP